MTTTMRWLALAGPAMIVGFAPELAARIQQRYPDDRATGFAEGDLRGAIWAEVTRRKPEAP